MIKRVEKNPGSPTSPKRGSSGLAVLLATGCASTGGGVLSAGAVALGPGSTALAANYNDLVAQGYRWATGDGPYASPTKDDLCLILKGYSEDKELELVEQLRVYYPIGLALASQHSTTKLQHIPLEFGEATNHLHQHSPGRRSFARHPKTIGNADSR